MTEQAPPDVDEGFDARWWYGASILVFHFDRVCQLIDKTPLADAVSTAYEPEKERVRVRHHAVEMALQALK